MNASLTVTSPEDGSSNSCSTGALTRVANVSAGSSSTGSRLIVASAAPVSMFVEPGADAGGDGPGLQPVLLAGVCDRAVDHGLLVAAQHVPQPRLCAGLDGFDLVLQQRLAEARDIAVSEDAEAPAKNLVRSPSRSTYWLARKRIVACATVSRTVGSVSAVFSARFGAVETTVRLLRRSQGQTGIDGLVFPGAAQPGVFGVVDDLPGPFGARSGHHIEVVHVIAGRGDGRAVITVRHQHDVAGAHLFEHLDRAVGRAVHAVVSEAA